jgi:hypothetical protein
MKKIAIFVVYNIVVVLSLLILLEFIIRSTLPEIKPYATDKRILVDSMYYDSRGLKPLSAGYSNEVLVNVDRFGFRKCSIPVDKLKKSWLFLGDSITMGIGVEDDSTFACIIQNQVDSLNILNPSVIGYAAKDYRNVFKYFVVDKVYNLDIIKVTIFWALNDVYFTLSDIETPGGHLRYLLGDFLKFLRLNSKLYLFIKNLAFDRPKSYYNFDERFYSEDNPEFVKSINEIIEINQLCSERNIDFHVVALPYEYQLRNPNSMIRKPQKIISTRLRNEGIRMLDPMEFFRETSKESKEFFLYGDGMHLSNRGHRLLAEFVIKSLIESQNDVGSN